jgi:hypothetical protein
MNREFDVPRGEEWEWFFAALIVFTTISFLLRGWH